MNRTQISEFFDDTLVYINDLEADNASLRKDMHDLRSEVKSLETQVENLEDQIDTLNWRTAAEILNLEHPEQELLEVCEAAIADLGYWRFLQVLQDVQARLAKYYITEHA